MSPTSPAFIGFVLASAAVYGLIQPALRRWLLLALSLTFYALFNVGFLLILGAVILASYVAGLVLERQNAPRWRLWAATLTITAPLLFYKYILTWATGALAPYLPVSALDFGTYGAVLVPVGLSFYTFQCLGYVFDVARRTVPAERDFASLALFVAFFPQLLAGPIERFGALADQLKAARRPDPDAVLDGLVVLAYGVFLKVCLGDHLAVVVDSVYAAPARVPAAAAVFGVYGFTLQLYADFAGYSLIAVGAAMLHGVRLTVNFRQPLFSADIAEFWQRWHISLTRWIGDYIYRPLGLWAVRRKRLPQRLQMALTQFVTWITMGLWHGANWTFAGFGALQAVLLIGHAWHRPRRQGRLPRWRLVLGAMVTFHLVVLTFGLIRAASIGDYLLLIGSAVSGGAGFVSDLVAPFYAGLALAMMLTVDAVWRFRADWPARAGPAARAAALGGLVVAILLFGQSDGTAFIYFRF